MRLTQSAAFAIIAAIVALGCGCSRGRSISPSVELTLVPYAGPGGAARIEKIEGRVTGAKAGQRIVLFAKSGAWWAQPFSAIRKDSTFKSTTHIGSEYAALLVDPGFIPAITSDVLPAVGGSVAAITAVKGRASSASLIPAPKTLNFSGYEWEVRQEPSDSGGVLHANSAANAWTDAKGRLHLRIARESGEWACAEVKLLRGLGYGSYSFVVEDIPRLEPGTVLGMFTWDDVEAGQNHREIDIELSQWGDAASKNAQFVVQPFYVPANVFRFNSPAAALTHSFDWEPERVSFKTAQGNSPYSAALAEHVFSSGIPSPGGESIHINLYTYGKSRTRQEHGVEVVIDKFEYLP